MMVQPVTTNFKGYCDLSGKILKSDRKELINLAEFFHTAPKNELQQITKSSKEAYAKLKEAISRVITRKKCYLADGASYFSREAKKLDNKAENRKIFMQA